MNSRVISILSALLFCLAGAIPAGAASDTSLDRIVTQIGSMFPPMEGVVVSIDKNTLILDLKQGQPIKQGDRLKLIRFGTDIIHPVSKKKIGRKETDLGEVEVIEVRRDFSLARLMDPTVLARSGDGVRSAFNKLSFLVAPPAIETSKKIDKYRLRLELEKKLADHPRFNVPVFELGLWLLENNLNVQNLLKQKNLNKLNNRVKADYLLVPSVKSVIFNNFAIVVLSPPGMTSMSTEFNSSTDFTDTTSNSATTNASVCSAKSPCKLKIPTFILG